MSEWSALGISVPASGPNVMVGQLFVNAPFRGQYLIVTSPGWFIHEARAGRNLFLENIDGDAYSRDEHDRLERLGQLERHRLTCLLEIGNALAFHVSPRCTIASCGEREAVITALAGTDCPHPHLPFSAVIIGTRP